MDSASIIPTVATQPIEQVSIDRAVASLQHVGIPHAEECGRLIAQAFERQNQLAELDRALALLRDMQLADAQHRRIVDAAIGALEHRRPAVVATVEARVYRTKHLAHARREHLRAMVELTGLPEATFTAADVRLGGDVDRVRRAIAEERTRWEREVATAERAVKDLAKAKLGDGTYASARDAVIQLAHRAHRSSATTNEVIFALELLREVLSGRAVAKDEGAIRRAVARVIEWHKTGARHARR